MHISDLRIVTELDEQYKDAELKVYLAVTNAGKETEKNIAARLSIGGLPVVLDQVIPELSPAKLDRMVNRKSGRSPKWDNEHPYLYTMKIELGNADVTTEQIEKRFGFREVEVQGKPSVGKRQAGKN